MSSLKTFFQWNTMRLLRPYFRNRYIDKGKWFLIGLLNPKPGIEEEWAPLGTRICRMNGGARIHCEMVYAADRFVYFTGEYEFKNTRLMRRVLNRRWRFVDVGANVGKYTLIAAGLAAEVIAVEPNPAANSRLRANLNLNQFDNVRVLTCGLSDQKTRGAIHQSGINIGGATMLTDRSFTSEESIEVVRGDDVIPSTSLRTYLKVDVEGLEFSVLRGLVELLRTRNVLVQIEVTDSWLRADGGSADQLFAFMRDLGYSAFRITHRTKIVTTVDVERLDKPLPNFQYDVLFAPATTKGEFWSWASPGDSL